MSSILDTQRLILVFISGGEQRRPLPITDNSFNEMRWTKDEDHVPSVSLQCYGALRRFITPPYRTVEHFHGAKRRKSKTEADKKSMRNSMKQSALPLKEEHHPMNGQIDAPH